MERATSYLDQEALARSEEQGDDPEGVGAKVPRFRAAAIAGVWKGPEGGYLTAT